MLCFRKLSVTKNFMDQRGVSIFFKEGVLSHSSERLRRGTLLCCVSEICRKQKVMDQRGVSIFFKEGLLSHSTEELRRGTV